jgi:hypothetical protein
MVGEGRGEIRQLVAGLGWLDEAPFHRDHSRAEPCRQFKLPGYRTAAGSVRETEIELEG